MNLDFANQIKYDDGTCLIPFKNQFMIEQYIEDVVTPELMEGAILNEEFEGFKNDYAVLHCLLRIAAKKYESLKGNVITKSHHFTVFEVGTNMGTGTNIICNAVKDLDPYPIVYSLDLPTELAHISLQHPISEGKGDRVGERCTFPFEQLRGDSMTFDFSKYPCDAYFIDGAHTEQHVSHELKQVLKCKPAIIIFHDADLQCVMDGIVAGMKGAKGYELYRVENTRIAYLQKK